MWKNGEHETKKFFEIIQLKIYGEKFSSQSIKMIMRNVRCHEYNLIKATAWLKTFQISNIYKM